MRTQLSETSTNGFVLNFKGDLDQLAALGFATISDDLVKISQNVYMFFLLDFVPSSLLLLQN